MSVVNARVHAHPVGSDPVVALVARGAAAQVTNLRRDPHATLVLRTGGPPRPLCEVHGVHPDPVAHDRAMASARPGPEHREHG